jgi:hypothetical protein
LAGDQTTQYQVNRRIKATVTAGTVYGYISASAYGALTTVTVVLDSGVLDSGLTKVELGLITYNNTSLFLMQSANIADLAVTEPKLALKVFNSLTEVTFDSLSDYVPIADSSDSGNKKKAKIIITDKIQPITASVGSGALTITLNPTVLDFRDATLGSGTVNTRTVSAAISVVISSGSTLGTTNAVQSRIAVLAIDNAGTVGLAAVNVAGGVNLDETGLITTVAEGGAGAADSALVIYSTTARTSVPYRVVGYVESTQATAGTWATAPSKIQGAGGQSALSTSLNAQGSAPMFVCRAWVNFNGTGTVAIRASGNVSSITDNGVGLYTVNFTTALQDASYTTCGIAGNTGSTGAIKLQDAVSPTPSAVPINVLNAGGTAALDTAQVHVAVFR